MATKKAAPKFSNKHIEIIAGSLSRPKDKRKQELLPQILREWCDVDLQRHWSIEGREAIRERMRKSKRFESGQVICCVHSKKSTILAEGGS